MKLAALPALLLAAAGVAGACASGSADAACYTVYDARNTLVYQSSTTPIDLSNTVSQQMAVRYPGRALVISQTEVCADTVTAVNGRSWVELAGDRADEPPPARRTARRATRSR